MVTRYLARACRYPDIGVPNTMETAVVHKNEPDRFFMSSTKNEPLREGARLLQIAVAKMGRQLGDARQPA